MEELKPCPFCGCKADVIIGQNWVQVGCPNCDITTKTTSVFGSIYEIIEAWNTRYESTCQMIQGIDEYSHKTEWKCSECGAFILRPVLPWRENFYCPGCGRRVVD